MGKKNKWLKPLLHVAGFAAGAAIGVPLPLGLLADFILVDDDLDDDDDNISLSGVEDLLQPTIQAPSPASSSQNQQRLAVCVVCRKKPPYSKNGQNYPTCGMNCANILQRAQQADLQHPNTQTHAQGHGSQRARGRGRGRGRGQPPASQSQGYGGRGRGRGRGGNGAHGNGHGHNNGRGGHHPVNGSIYQGHNTGSTLTVSTPNAPDSGSSNGQNYGNMQSPSGSGFSQQQQQQDDDEDDDDEDAVPPNLCVICNTRPCFSNTYVTCGLKCIEKLCFEGADPTMCDYCHRRPKVQGFNQCGKYCGNLAKKACLLCKSRPKYKGYHLCGKTCIQISMKKTPLLLEAPEGHDTFLMVKDKFGAAWMDNTPPPQIKAVYKVVEGRDVLKAYGQQKAAVGNENHRYYGTSRKCTLGLNGNRTTCNDSTCPLCNVVAYSFRTNFAYPNGPSGQGIYSSSASNRAYGYTHSGKGAVLMTKVVMGTPYNVNQSGAVTSLPANSHSVVFDRNNGSQDTVVYNDEAIRPVFLIVFA